MSDDEILFKAILENTKTLKTIKSNVEILGFMVMFVIIFLALVYSK